MRRTDSRSSAIASMRGVSLIEVLVSVVILGVGLLGVAAMQSLALRSGQSSLESSQAVIQTTSIIEAMRANVVNGASYNLSSMQCSVPNGGSQAQNDLRGWLMALKNTIGGGATTCGQITGCPGACVITVQWDDQRAGGSTARQLVTRATL